MIGVLAQGRLGNQMFQYAFGYIAAKKLKTHFFIYKPNSLHYFKLAEDFENVNVANYKAYAKRKFWKKSTLSFPKFPYRNFKNEYYAWAIRKDIMSWPNQLGTKDFMLKELKDDVVYDGYFQSEDYFAGYEQDVKKLLALKDGFVADFKQKKQDLLKKKYIAVHLRRTDYIEWGGDDLGGINMTLPVEFYKRSFEKIKNIDDYNVVFVSDDIDFVKKEFGEKENYFYESNSEIVDYQVLLNANILIIANSTFSWWAAWLNAKEGLEVYAPNYFLGFKVKKFYPSGIDVKGWNWIDVN